MRSRVRLLLSVLLVASIGIWWWRVARVPADSSARAAGSDQTSRPLADARTLARLTEIEATERRVAATDWAVERVAQEWGRVVDAFWDRLNAATNKLETVAAFPVGTVLLPRLGNPRFHRHGIEIREPAGQGRVLEGADWAAWIRARRLEGWECTQAEFRHTRFEPGGGGRRARSGYEFTAHLVRGDELERAILQGWLEMEWMSGEGFGEPGSISILDARNVALRTRSGPPGFVPWFSDDVRPTRHTQAIDPLVLHDIDGDGLSEVFLVARNLAYRREADGSFRAESLTQKLPGVVTAAVVADFDGVGGADLLCAAGEALWLARGTGHGGFEAGWRRVWVGGSELRYPMVLTCGDADGDGDLDVYLGQYMEPYEGGATPTPYFDSNDGNPAFFLVNDGRGQLTDATERAGLSGKRHRRCYSASFVNLDEDADLDLVVVSDFAGLDLYRNDGTGRFVECTGEWAPESHAFGMAHALADFEPDGRLDLLMIGMTSPTADRLEHLGLWRAGVNEDRSMRARMTAGNRLYAGRSGGGFGAAVQGPSIARSGWGWGCGVLDWDRDGYPDVYVANGMESRDTVRDYEAEYWLHDRYVGTSMPDAAAYLYYAAKFARTRERGQSYGGYEKNRFYLNDDGRAFVEVGHLLGLAIERDSRNVVTDDLDGDGRPDLLVISLERWPGAGQTLQIFRNVLDTAHHWIGFRFAQTGGGESSVGAQVRVHAGGRTAARALVTGDSYRSQTAMTVHFGLGSAATVEWAEIRWGDGRTNVLRNPGVDRYHIVPLPDRPDGAASPGAAQGSDSR